MVVTVPIYKGNGDLGMDTQWEVLMFQGSQMST